MCGELLSWEGCIGLCMIGLVLAQEICTIVYPLNVASDNACLDEGDIFPLRTFVLLLGLSGILVITLCCFASCCCEGAIGKLFAFGLLLWFIASILAYIEYFKLTDECKRESIAKLCLAWAIVKSIYMCCAAISIFGYVYLCMYLICI